MSVRLSGSRRWIPIKNFIYENYNISVHFSARHLGYVAAYRYVAKNKLLTDVLHSPGHSNLAAIGSPKTKKAMKRFSEKAKARKSLGGDGSGSTGSRQPASKTKRLCNADVADFIVKNQIRNDTELNNIAVQRKNNGEDDLYKFILNRNNAKAINDLIANTWRVHEAPQQLLRENTSIREVIEQRALQQCVAGCNGQWLTCAREILRWNGHNVYNFAAALRKCLTKGRAKHTNILLIGPTNCGKSFLLDPLELMFKAFVNPTTGRYAWVGIDECEVAFLNDFRWTSETISWSDLLLLLEGQTVHLPRPKNLYATDLVIDRKNKIPILATSKYPIEFCKYNVRDERECDMMATRWNTFEFSRTITEEEEVQLDACPACFSKLVLMGAEEDA